jgi:short subunit dehydrogenase-like uncharacterized protein
MAPDQLDLVLFGATGFVGQLTAAYLNNHGPDDVRVGLAGRSRDRLEQVRTRLGGRALDWPVIVADAGDRTALDAVVARTGVVATTVGPYSRYGLPLVAACAESGTHYADLTGEVLFMRESIDSFDAVARASGARIVHSAGFDSIPSDLGVLLLHDAVRRDGAGDLGDTTFVLTGVRGGMSGGTLASGRAEAEDVERDPAKRPLLADPYALSPDRAAEPDLGPEPGVRMPVYDEDAGAWLAPFLMAAINTRAVRRSNALQGWAYGRRFRYRESMAAGTGLAGRAKAAGIAAATAAATASLAFGPSRGLVSRVLPKPGEGPSEKVRANGYFTIDIHTRTTTGAHYVAHVAAKGDPGYAATAVMLGESALALAFDADRLPGGGGVLTPATGLGLPVVERLRAAGMTFDVARRDEPGH